MHSPTADVSRPARQAPPVRSQRMWTVHAVQRINGSAEDGVRAIVPAGNYILREVDEITYELDDSTELPLLTLKLSEVAAHRRNGALVIDGLWP